MEQISKTWKLEIKFEGRPSPDTLEMVDVNEISEGYIHVKRDFFDNLIENVKDQHRYSIGKGIQSVFDPTGKNWTENPWILLMTKENSQKTQFWILLKRERNLSGYIVAIGPKGYYHYLSEMESNKVDEIKKLIEYVVSYPAKFNLLVLIPNYVD
jgi:hypothetical protein